MQIRPLKGQALVRLIPKDYQSAAGLILPDIAYERKPGEREQPVKAFVVAIGPWRTGRNGFAIIPEISVGQRVIVSVYRGTKVTKELGGHYMLVDVEDILACLQEELMPVDSNSH